MINSQDKKGLFGQTFNDRPKQFNSRNFISILIKMIVNQASKTAQEFNGCLKVQLLPKESMVA